MLINPLERGEEQGIFTLYSRCADYFLMASGEKAPKL